MGDDEALRGLLEDARERDAATGRGQRRRLRDQAVEESTLAGTLRDFAEAGATVAVRTVAGRTHRGTVVGVGDDFCALRCGPGRWVYVRWDGLASVRAEADVVMADAGGRRRDVDRTLVEVLAELAPDRPRVQVRVGADSEALLGELRAVGDDVLVVRLEGARRDAVFVNADAVTDVAVEVA